VIFLTITLDLVGFGMVVPLLPLYAQKFSVTGTAVAFLFASYSLMQFFCAPLWGQLSDRIGRRPVLLISIFANMVALLLYAAATSYLGLLGARLLAGVCTANISVANAYVADLTAPEDRARGMGMVGAAFGIGFVIGPFLGGELSVYGHAVPPLAAAALSLLNFTAAFIRLPESLPKERRSTSLQNVFAQRWAFLLSGAIGLPVLLLLFLQILGFSMMEMALVLFAKARLGFDARSAGRLFAFIGVVLVLVQGGLVGRMARRYGEVALVRGGICAMAIGMFLVPYTPQGVWPVLLLSMALLGAGQGLCSPSLSSLLSRQAPMAYQGAALGVGQSVSALARVVGPQIGGLAYDGGGENLPFWLGGLLMGAAASVAFVMLQPPGATAPAPGTAAPASSATPLAGASLHKAKAP
jgi:DHA1 family tetracycline resistance protein-like MFS transporter